MLASTVTLVVIVLIICGVGFYAFRRISKVHRAEKARTAAHEAALLAEVTANRPTKASTSPTPGAFAVKTNTTPEAATQEQATISPVPPVAPYPEVPTAGVRPVSVQDDIRAFLGEPAETQVPPHDEAQVTPEPVPPVFVKDEEAAESEVRPSNSAFDAAADNLAQALRDAARVVEESAASTGSQQERATRTLLAVTTAISALPLSSLVTAEDDTASLE